MFRRTLSTVSLLLLALALLLAGAGAASAAEIAVDYSGDFVSHYVWRGLTLVDGAVFQPSITISHESGFSFNTWGNLDIDDVNSLEGEFSELDLALAYAFPTEGILSAELGYIDYTFPNTVFEGTREVYLGLGLDVVASPSLTLYYDMDEVDALYAELGVSFGSEFGDRGAEWGVDLIASFADSDFAAFYAGGADSGLFAGTIGGSLSIPAGEIWGVSFFANYTDSLDTMVLPTQKVDFYGGISIAASF